MRLIISLLFCVLAFPSSASSEKILIDGEEYSFLHESQFPLDSQFSENKIEALLAKQSGYIQPRTTDVSRQYGSMWELHGNQLFLREVYSGNQRLLSILFPDKDSPVNADWFSGFLLLGKGHSLRCDPNERHCLISGPFPIYYRYESYLKLKIEKGYLLSLEDYDPNVPQQKSPPESLKSFQFGTGWFPLEDEKGVINSPVQ